MLSRCMVLKEGCTFAHVSPLPVDRSISQARSNICPVTSVYLYIANPLPCILLVCIVLSRLSSILWIILRDHRSKKDRSGRHAKLHTLNIIPTINKSNTMIEVDHQGIRIYFSENDGGRRSWGPTFWKQYNVTYGYDCY